MIRTACACLITPSVVPTIQVADAPSRLAYGKHLEKTQSLAIPAINPLAKASPAPDGSTAFPLYAWQRQHSFPTTATDPCSPSVTMISRAPQLLRTWIASRGLAFPVNTAASASFG